MKIARFYLKDKPAYCLLENGYARQIEGSIFSDNIVPGNMRHDIKTLRMLAPVTPSKVVCVGLNYIDHAKELNMPIPREPIIFLKPPTAVIGPGDKIVYPDEVSRLDYEAELAIVIKKAAKQISLENASDYILGYTCLNDITARDLQARDGQWTRAKSFDTFCPIGPCIATDIDPSALNIRLCVNGELKL